MSDKTKQELVEKATGWALAIFVYGTAIFYFAKYSLDLTGDDLDAYVAMLSAGATLFAGFVAIYLFSDWKVQHNKTLFSTEAKEIWLLIGDIEYCLTDLELAIKNSPSQFLGFCDLSSYHNKYNKLTQAIEKFEPKYAQFIALTENEKLYAPYHKYDEYHGEFSNFYKINKNQLIALKDIKIEENTLRLGMQAPLIAMKDMLHKYIVIK